MFYPGQGQSGYRAYPGNTGWKMGAPGWDTCLLQGTMHTDSFTAGTTHLLENLTKK